MLPSWASGEATPGAGLEERPRRTEVMRLVLAQNYQDRGFEICEECNCLKSIENFPNNSKICKTCLREKRLSFSLPDHAEAILPHSESIPLYNIVKGIGIILHSGNIITERTTRQLIETLSGTEINKETLKELGRILSEDQIRELTFYFLREQAATQYTISKILRQPEQTIYRNLKLLSDYKLIKPSQPIHGKTKIPGPKPIIYQVPDAPNDAILSAIELHSKLRSPIFTSVHRISQLLIEDYFAHGRKPQIIYRDLLDIVKSEKVPEPTNVANLTAKNLTEKGWQVWR